MSTGPVKNVSAPSLPRISRFHFLKQLLSGHCIDAKCLEFSLAYVLARNWGLPMGLLPFVSSLYSILLKCDHLPYTRHMTQPAQMMLLQDGEHTLDFGAI